MQVTRLIPTFAATTTADRHRLGDPRVGELSALGVLFAGGFVLQILWVNPDILLPLIGSSFHTNAGNLGLVLGAFPIGYAAAAFPSGVAVLRWGHRSTLVAGLSLMGSAGGLAALSSSVSELVALRFLCGMGGGLVFAPTVSLLSEMLSPRLRSSVIGLYVSSGLGIGGALGFVTGAVWGPAYGWPFVFAVTGAISLLMAALARLLLPRGNPARGAGAEVANRVTTARILRSRSVWGLTAGFAGAAMTGSVAVAFIAAYVTTVHSTWGIGFAGLLGSVTLLATVPGSLIGGWLSERGHDRRVVGMLFAIGFGLLAVLIPFLDQEALLAEFVVLGVLVGALLPILFAMPSYLRETQGGGTAVAVGVIETSQVFLQGASAVVFGFVVVGFGYTPAWVVFGIVAIATLPALLFVTPNRAIVSGA